MNTLAKFKHKTSSHGAPLLSFRFNPGDDDLEVCKNDTAENAISASEAADNQTNRRDSNDSDSNKSRKNSGSEDGSKVDSNGNDSVKEPSSQLETLLKDSRDSSPLKESVKEYLQSKVGKRSVSLDYTPSTSADNEGWSILNEIKGKFARRMEGRAERLKKEATLDTVQEKNPESKPFISSRSQSSCDVRSRLEEDSGVSVEQGLDCAATDDSQVPYSYHLQEKDGVYVAFSQESSQLTPARKSAVAAMALSAQALLARKRSKNFSNPITLSSLKATRSLESEILEDSDLDDEPWEHVEVSRRVEEKPEEPMIFENVTSSEDFTQQSDGSEWLSSETGVEKKDIWTFFLQPSIHKRLTVFIVVFLGICFAPISNFLSGFLMGVFISTIIGSFLVWFLHEPKPKEPIKFPNYSTLPPLRIPSRDIRKDDCRIFKGWMNELDSEYNADTYHVNSSHSIFVRLDGTSLRLSKPKINVPKRAMWNEPKYNPVFINQRHLEITDAVISLPPVGLAKKRIWSKKYPICLALKSPQTTSVQQFSPQGWEDDGSENTCSNNKPTVLYLFARTSREKEEWFRRFQSAAESALLQSVGMPVIDYNTYGKWIVSEESILSYVKSACPANDPCYGDTVPQHIWFNALIGRVFYDFLTKAVWSQVVAERIQKKLSVIKVPYFMEELKLKDINLGSNLPIFHRMSQPVSDDRGLWVDFDVTYKGTFQMTLETKLNLLKLKKEHTDILNPLDEKANQIQSAKSYLCNSDEESSAESSSEDEISPTDSVETSQEDSASISARAASTSKTLLKWVDKITQSRYFQQATENRYIKKAMTEVSNTPLVLTVEVHALVGTLALNIPPPPSDRLWYGFRGNPQLSITARPKLGLHEVTFAHITEWIEKKLTLEFQKLLVIPNMDDLVIPIMESGLQREEKVLQPASS